MRYTAEMFKPILIFYGITFICLFILHVFLFLMRKKQKGKNEMEISLLECSVDIQRVKDGIRYLKAYLAIGTIVYIVLLIAYVFMS